MRILLPQLPPWILTFIGYLGYIVDFIMAYHGSAWWKAALAGAVLTLILSFALSIYTDPLGAVWLFLFSGPAILISFPIILIVCVFISALGLLVRKWAGK